MNSSNVLRNKLLLFSDKEMKKIINKISFENHIDNYETVSFNETFNSANCSSTSTKSTSDFNCSKNTKENLDFYNSVDFLQKLCNGFKKEI